MACVSTALRFGGSKRVVKRSSFGGSRLDEFTKSRPKYSLELMDVVQLPEDAISKIRPWSYTLSFAKQRYIVAGASRNEQDQKCQISDFVPYHLLK